MNYKTLTLTIPRIALGGHSLSLADLRLWNSLPAKVHFVVSGLAYSPWTHFLHRLFSLSLPKIPFFDWTYSEICLAQQFFWVAAINSCYRSSKIIIIIIIVINAQGMLQGNQATNSKLLQDRVQGLSVAAQNCHLTCFGFKSHKDRYFKLSAPVALPLQKIVQKGVVVKCTQSVGRSVSEGPPALIYWN